MMNPSPSTPSESSSQMINHEELVSEFLNHSASAKDRGGQQPVTETHCNGTISLMSDAVSSTGGLLSSSLNMVVLGPQEMSVARPCCPWHAQANVRARPCCPWHAQAIVRARPCVSVRGPCVSVHEDISIRKYTCSCNTVNTLYVLRATLVS